MTPSPPGALLHRSGTCQFTVWAPAREKVELHLLAPDERIIPLSPCGRGYHSVRVNDVAPCRLYVYRLDGELERPDPASRHQPQGVHGPSAVVATDWAPDGDHWHCPPLGELVFYELHVGAFTPEGTLDAVIPRLETLSDLGVIVVELMPAAQFAGRHGWGYDGVYPYAVHNTYGGPDALARFVQACHARGIAVALDVCYNHMGPEGNYLDDFGPYFTRTYRTPWGRALNFDGPDSDAVRRHFIESALYFVTDLHVDILRVDAIQAIVDASAPSFLQELADTVRARAQQLGRRVHLVAESDRNDTRTTKPFATGGLGFDAQWSDDFHHAIHALLTGEHVGYYRNFGELEHLRVALQDGFVYQGQYSEFHRRRHGTPADVESIPRLVICTQNHDQIGNRPAGDRLAATLSFDRQKLAAALLMLAPSVPLLFMGQEYGETAPFPFFTDYADEFVARSVRRGRQREFRGFGWRRARMPDPQDPQTFASARLKPDLAGRDTGRALWDLHRELIRLRREEPALGAVGGRHEVTTIADAMVLMLRRGHENHEAVAVFSFADCETSVNLPLSPGHWCMAIDTEADRWLGEGGQAEATFSSPGTVPLSIKPMSCLLFLRGDGETT